MLNIFLIEEVSLFYLVHLLGPEMLLKNSLSVLVDLVEVTELQIEDDTFSAEAIEDVLCIVALLKEIVDCLQ